MSKIRHIDFSPKLSVRYVSGYSQWGYGYVQEIVLNDLDGDVEVHYALTESGGTAVVVKPTVEDGVITVEVPNFLFAQESTVDYKAYGFIYTKGKKSGDTIKKIIMHVDARPKPADYVYNETELKTYEALEKRIEDLEKLGVSDERIEEALTKYLKDNPIDVVIDDALSEESTNAVQNRAVTKSIKDIETTIGNIDVMLGTI